MLVLLVMWWKNLLKGGDQVVAGQPLYRIDSRQYESNVATAEANVARANADYQNAETDLGRYETLASQDAIARQRVDTQRSPRNKLKRCRSTTSSIEDCSR